jgi:predicted kinase
VTATLHFIFGLPGAGKTGLARALATDVPAVPFIEDEWVAALAEPIASLEDFLAASRRARKIIAPLATRILELGLSVVFDFAANTARDRAWARSIFEAARADHRLHVLDVAIDECRRRVRERNATRPAGLYFGDVGDAMFDRVVPHVVPPHDDEGFHVVKA